MLSLAMTELFDQMTITELMRDIEPDDLTFEKAAELFETIYMASRNLAQRTRIEYRNDLKQLTEFLKKRGINKPSQVSLSQLQAFLAFLDARNYTGTTRRRKTSSIKAFFGFLTQVSFLMNNPSTHLMMPEREYKEPRFLTQKEYQALLRACAHQTRDAAIIELILQTGIRLSEAARLTIDNIELPARINRDPGNTGSISIKGKGRKQRTLPLNYKACRALKAWFKIRPEIDDPALFITKFRQPLGPRAIQNIVAKYLREAKIKNASVHTLRHTFGTQHVARGTSLRTVQEALGHTDLKTTSIYVATAKRAMKKELQEHAL